MAPQATRRKANKKSAGNCQRIDKHAKELALNIVATRIESVRTNNGDGATAPYGAISTIIEEILPTFPWLTKTW
jgi:hypothetical protein